MVSVLLRPEILTAAEINKRPGRLFINRRWRGNTSPGL
ncbi:hypothetical protein ACZ87_01795 [Candidatus Erwinia dacicola]|uniref:Uncharacterized protein n=1 Tax=Candidatus Erwinia dacicola TaxID=252393 RepID=A0A328TLG8_9GAMM|nr:hypothetical protein ACZ87_01795 [Candidatus Erwinia dacicola]